jgi:thiamine biosynthesis lipoprotein
VSRRRTRIRRAEDGHWVGTFQAMASPCEVLMDVSPRQEALRLLAIVSGEAWRIEDKFSRYLRGNIVDAINRSEGAPIGVDEETARLLDFATKLHALSEGRFDITSGVLGRVWAFDGRRARPSQDEIAAVLPLVGWQRADWDGHRVRLEPGMQIDLGGIGKEYAVDRAAHLVAEATEASCVVNFGGDLVLSRPRPPSDPWRVGIEDVTRAGRAIRVVLVTAGALATSGTAKRFLLADGVRYSHILDPTTGWPVEDCPRSVTVAGDSCVEAGMTATLAMLQGAGAESFLAAQGVRCWITRVDSP